MLERALEQNRALMDIESDTLLAVSDRKKFLEDKFIKQYKPTTTISKNPVKDDKELET